MLLDNVDHYLGFRNGDERALSYMYGRYYRALCRHGQQIVDDEFAVSCIVHEAFLKGWQFRETMESLRHIYCFIRLDVSWKCYAYLRHPVHHFHRRLVQHGGIENLGNYCDEQCTAENHLLAEKKLKAIEEALPYLPANRQTIMTLYFRHGLSYKKIARRFGTSGQAITNEVQKSLESLRNIVHAQKRLQLKKTVPDVPNCNGYTGNTGSEMQQIFRLRYEQKQSFAAIAEAMKLPQGYVQQQYVKAHRQMQQHVK